MNLMREVSKFMSLPANKHMRALLQIIRYCVGTSKQGLTLKPEDTWDGSKSHVFQIEGRSNLDFAKDKTRKSISGWSTFLSGAAVCYRSKMMPVVALSVTEVELFAAT